MNGRGDRVRNVLLQRQLGYRCTSSSKPFGARHCLHSVSARGGGALCMGTGDVHAYSSTCSNDPPARCYTSMSQACPSTD